VSVLFPSKSFVLFFITLVVVFFQSSFVHAETIDLEQIQDSNESENDSEVDASILGPLIQDVP
jgi:hypothetical protein